MNKLKQGIMAAAVDQIRSDGEAQSVTRSYRFRRDFAGFSGHFPGNPILPAIVQILTVVSMMEEHTGRVQQLLSVEDAKFLNPVYPDQEILVNCRQRTIGGKLLHEAKLRVDDKPVATFLLQMESGGCSS
jgi:3-hydroxyacyl-[acyl-carrier-protein] dehydratase